MSMSHVIGVVWCRSRHEEALLLVTSSGPRPYGGEERLLSLAARQHPEPPRSALPFRAASATLDLATAQSVREIVAKGAMPPLVLIVDDCRAACERMRALGVEFTQEPVERYGSVDAGFRDPSGNGWKMIQAR